MMSMWIHSQRFWIISESECRRQMSFHSMASVLVRSRRFWNNSPECQNSDDCVGNLCGSDGVYWRDVKPLVKDSISLNATRWTWMSKHCKGVSEETTTRILKSAIGGKAEVCKVLGWCQSASGLQMRTKTQVFRLLRTRGFSALHLRSNLSAMKSRSWPFSIRLMSSFIQQTETSYAAHTGQFGQIVGMLEQMLSRIQSDMWSRRVWLLIRSLWLPRMRVWRKCEAWNLVQRSKLGTLNSNRQLLFNKLTVCSIAGGRSREDDWVRRLTIGKYPVSWPNSFSRSIINNLKKLSSLVRSKRLWETESCGPKSWRGAEQVDGSTHAKEQRFSCKCSNCAHHSERSWCFQTRDWAVVAVLQDFRWGHCWNGPVRTRFGAQGYSGRVDGDWRCVVCHPVWVRVNHPRDACCGRCSARSVHPRWENRDLRVCSQWVKAMTSMLKGTIQDSWIEDPVSRTASKHWHRSSLFPHTSSEFWNQEQLRVSMFQLAQQVLHWRWRGQLFRRGKSAQPISSCLNHNRQASLEGWCQFSQVQGETKLPAEGPRLRVEFRWASPRRRKSPAVWDSWSNPRVKLHQAWRSEETQRENFFSHPREQHDCGCGDGPACARHLRHHWRRHRRRLHSHRLRKDLWAVHAGPVCSLREAIHRVSGVFKSRELHSFSLCLQRIIVPEGVQRWQAEDQCSVQPQHRDRNPAGLTQQTTQSMTKWCSQDRPDRRHEQVEEGCRSTALYSSSPRNRRTSSSVCKAGALVSPSSCLDGEPHGWVPVDTHSTPVPSMTGEAVGGLCSIRAQSTTGKCATRTW